MSDQLPPTGATSTSPAIPAAPPVASAPPAVSPPLLPAVPAVTMSPTDEKAWAVITHLSPLAGTVTGLGFLAPVLLYVVLRRRGPFIRDHVTESLNALISVTLYTVLAAFLALVLTVLTLGLGLLSLVVFPGAVMAAALIFWIVAAIEAGRGRWYRYPLIIRFVR